VEFVAGNTLFVLLHEMAHVLIAEMKLPVLGARWDWRMWDSCARLPMRMTTVGIPP
jgi:hypothetical protein